MPETHPGKLHTLTNSGERGTGNTAISNTFASLTIQGLRIKVRGDIEPRVWQQYTDKQWKIHTETTYL